jgi:hypothetical protein
MFSGTSESTNKSYTPYTGMAAFKILAVNPTKTEIEDIINRPYPLEVNYDLRTDNNGNSVRPIEFWVTTQTNNVTITDRITFQIGDTTVKSQSGNYQYVNTKGISRYGQTIEEVTEKYKTISEKSAFVRPMVIGEDALYNFMQRALGYKSSEENAQFLTDCEQANITPTSLYQGDVNGLRGFIEFVNGKSRKIGLVLGVKPKEKLLDDGTKVTQNRQVILNNPDFFFTLAGGVVTDYNTGKLQEVIDYKIKNNASLGTALFTIGFQQYKKEDCVNNMPSNPQASAISWG